jgi:hydroxymethylpyrimidine pyrophosphatase-like HAD family hydrolase
MTESPATRDTSREVRLVVADVDGTLLTPGKVLRPRARAAVQVVIEAGIAFTITSGRPPLGMTTLIDALRLKHPVSAFNGGLFVRPDLSAMRERRIAFEIVPKIIDTLTRGGLDVWIYTDTDWCVRSRHGWKSVGVPVAAVLPRCDPPRREQG